MFLLKTWLEFFRYLSDNPQSLLLIAVLLLIILFGLSRFNNFMEEKGVDRAIHITRAFVGFLMYFIVAPIVIFIFINVLAFLNGVPMLDISFLGNWISLTFTSYLWLLNCIFQNKDVVGQEEAYTVDAVIRIIWILLPISLIWIQINKKLSMRLLLIPMIVAVVIVCKHKKAEETFITKDVDIETLRQAPIIGYFFKEKADKEDAELMTSGSRQIMAVLFGALLIAGLGIGVFSKQRLAGLSTAAVAVLGFVLISPTGLKKTQNKDPIEKNPDNLIRQLYPLYEAEGPESKAVLKLTIVINEIYDNRKDLEFPDSLCRKYRQFFPDRCD